MLNIHLCARGPPHIFSLVTASAAQIYSRLLRPWPTSDVESAQLTAASVSLRVKSLRVGR